jgi:hypothetical protein
VEAAAAGTSPAEVGLLAALDARWLAADGASGELGQAARRMPPDVPASLTAGVYLSALRHAAIVLVDSSRGVTIPSAHWGFE